MLWLDGITDSMDITLNKLWEMVKNREAWCTVAHRVTKSWTWVSDWTELMSDVSFASSCSVTKLCPTLCDPTDAACQASLSCNISQSLLNLMSTESVMASNHLILCYPLFLLPWIFPNIRVFSNKSALHIWWPKYWSFSFSSPSNEYSVLISFRMDWLDLLVVQRTLKSLRQHHRMKASILQC